MPEIPSREDYEAACALLNGTRGAVDFDENFSDDDRAVARELVTIYEAAAAAEQHDETERRIGLDL